MNHKIVRGDTGLTGIEKLSPGYTLGCQFNIGRTVDDARALAAKFQHHRSKVLRSFAHHDSAQLRASGEEN